MLESSVVPCKKSSRSQVGMWHSHTMPHGTVLPCPGFSRFNSRQGAFKGHLVFSFEGACSRRFLGLFLQHIYTLIYIRFKV